MNSAVRNRLVALGPVWGVFFAGAAVVLHGMVFDVVRLRSPYGFAAVGLSGSSVAIPVNIFERVKGSGIFEVSGMKGNA